MLLMSQREIIKEELLFLLENSELLLSSKRYNEVLEKVVNILSLLDNKSLSLFRFLDFFKKILIVLDTKKEISDKIDILDFLIMAVDLLKEFEDEIYDMDFEQINLDTFLLQSSKQLLLLNKELIKTLSILNLLQKDELEYFLKNNKFKYKKKIDLILSPMNEIIIQKIKQITDRPVVVVYDEKVKEKFNTFDNIYFLSNKLDEDEFNEALIEILNTYECEYIKDRLNDIDTLKPLNETITKLQNLQESASLRDISKIISSDLALGTKLVNFVNKPYFGVVKEIISPSQAITFLGKEKTLAFSFGLAISDNLGLNLDNYNLNETKFYKINFLRLQLANFWYRKVNFSDFIVISSAAMLGAIGKLFLNPIIDKIDKQKFKTLVKIDRLFAENEVLQTSSEEISANLLNHWGFSNALVNSIYYSNNIENSLPEYRHLAIVNYVIFNTFDLNDEVDEKIVENMVDFLKEMNFDTNLYLEAIEKIKDIK